MDAGPIGGLHTATARAGLSLQEICYPLGRCHIAAGLPVSRLLNAALPMHAGQRIIAAKVGRIHRNQQRGVGIVPCPVGIAHAVGDDAALFRCRSHHITAGTHAEGIHRAVGKVLHQLIIRRGQRRILTAVLRQIHHSLGMFDPHAHGKGLCLHGNALLLQLQEGIPGAVADGQDDMIRFDLLAFFGHQACHTAIVGGDGCQLGIEPNLTAQGNDPLANVLHHRQQHIRAHMGFRVKEDILPGARCHKLLQNPLDAWIIDAGIQLTVGECTGTAFAKLHIGFFVQLTGPPKGLHLFMAR